MMRTKVRLLCLLLLLVLSHKVGGAEPAGERKAITPEVKKALKRCWQLTSACQLDDGAITQVAHAGAEAPVLIVPYFGHYVALAWIALHDQFHDEASLAAAQRWLDWCATHQEVGGYWNHWEGTRRQYRNLDVCDAWDSSAALYLLVLDRFTAARGTASPDMIAAAQKSLVCLEGLVVNDGLTIAKADYKVMFLMDNIESAAGARAAASLFERLKKPDERQRATQLLDGIARELPGYWDKQEAIHAWARHPSGAADVRLKMAYPDALAQLFAISHLPADSDPHPKSALFAKIGAKFKPDKGPMAAVGVERWYMAAAEVGGRESLVWRGKLLAEIQDFGADIYSYRPAIAILALLEGGTTLEHRP